MAATVDLNAVRFKLTCGGSVTLTAKVDRRGCQCGGVDCPTSADVAGIIWLALQEPATVPADDEHEG